MLFNVNKILKIKYLILLILGTIFSVLSIYQYVSYKYDKDLTYRIADLNNEKVAIVLGTSKYKPNGGINPYYANRIKAAVKLYLSGTVKYIIVSGDNQSKEYNEPQKMKQDLMKEGIPGANIYYDFAGFSTLDSIIRAKEVFGQKSFIIISQKFHNERALYIAKHFGINAQAYNADNPNNGISIELYYREHLARVKLFLDLYIFKTKPKFLGKKITIV